MIENPWVGLDSDRSPYVAAVDRVAMDSYLRKKRTQRPEFLPNLAVVPEPWCGPVLSANVLVLSGNPHWDDRDNYLPDSAHRQMWNNLSGTHPLFWLQDELRETTGANWYRSNLLKDVLGVCNANSVSSKLALVDFVGYRSHKWDHSLRIPSQEFTAQIVRTAIADGKVILLTRGRKQWVDLIPELDDYEMLFRNNSPQNVRISVRNTSQEGFDAIVGALS